MIVNPFPPRPKCFPTYLLNCGFWLGNVTAGAIYNASISKNDVELVANDAVAAPGAGISTATTTTASLAAGDRVYCGLRLNGPALTLAPLNRRCQFSAARIY